MIIGLTGTIGAGKGTVVEYLKETKGFAHYSVRDFLMEELDSRGLSRDRDNLREVANALRLTHSPSYLIELAYARAVEKGGDALIESVRAIGEAEFLRANGAFLLAVDADRKLRYERIHARGSSTDHVDFDTWVAQEEKELASTEPNEMNVIGVMHVADYRIENDGSLEELHEKVEAMLAAFSK
ncbi:MAG TPA: AAA family ATPase [Candidatus Paceibacterota bacterium]|nr:AAA family ATPase [Candidatus Paceibacterota bacterium]